jgi:hypothetical protein
MKKLGIICLVLVIALGTVGVAFGWNQSLAITGKVSTGTWVARFNQSQSNDTGTLDDPSNQGGWTMTGSSGSYVLAWPVPPGTRANKKKCVTTAGLSTTTTANDTMTMSITTTNGFVDYYPSTGVEIYNQSSVPVKVKTVTITKTSALDPSFSKLTVTPLDALIEANHTRIDPGRGVLGSLYCTVLTSGAPNGLAYSIKVVISFSPFNAP